MGPDSPVVAHRTWPKWRPCLRARLSDERVEMKVTASVIKADVGSIGGHTRPSQQMLDKVNAMVRDAQKGPNALLIDGMVTHTGDDIALIMSHRHGTGATNVHQFAWDCFLAGTQVAQEQGLYGAGQD